MTEREQSPNIDQAGGNGKALARRAICGGPRLLLLVQIADFIELRRALGPARLREAMAEYARRIAERVPEAEVIVSGRDTIELAQWGVDHTTVAATLGRIIAIFDTDLGRDIETRRVEAVVGGAIGSASVDATILIEEAEVALAEAASGKCPIVRDVHEALPHPRSPAFVGELSDACERDEFLLHYQPKVHVRRQEVTSLEALIRWRHPTRGFLYPSDFIPTAEATTAMVPITLWTIRRVIADQRTLAEYGHLLPIYINIAGALLADHDFVHEVCALVRGSGAKIGFEITETSVIRDPESAIANLKTFSNLGIVIAIDDYGAGLSSLAYLKRLPARELKIDKLFITQLTSSNRDPLIVRSTIDLAHAMEMEVVAEGVETPAALALLSVMGCDMVQGFLISRPIALDAITAFLDQDCATMFDSARMTSGKLAASLRRIA